MVNSDDVAASCLDLHGVADDLMLVFLAAEYDAWCTWFDESYCAVFGFLLLGFIVGNSGR